MTGHSGDPEFEAERQRQMHRLRVWAGKQPVGPGNPVHVLVFHQAGTPPAVRLFALARWSFVKRLVHDAGKRDSRFPADGVADLGPDALMLAQTANKGEWNPGEMAVIGVAEGNRWLWWLPPTPIEPVPGSPGAAAQRN
jgi:hypothetical protein